VPLAIELAAQLCATMSLSAVARELAQGIDLLTGPPLSGRAPHASLRESIARSYVSLDPDEQCLFRRLSLLPGGADIATAEATTADLCWSRRVLHGVLGRLVYTSMVSAGLDADPDAPGWFTVLEPLRAFGREQLHAGHETDVVHGLLCTWLADRARTLWTQNFRSPIAEGWKWTDGELTNLRYAAEVLRGGAQPGYALLAATAAKLLIQHGEFDEADVLLEQVLATPGISMEDEARARCVNGHGLVLRARFDEAHAQLTTAYELAEAAADEPLALQVLSSLIATYSEAEADRASALSRTLLSRVRAGSDTELLATVCLKAAWYFVAGGYDGEARAAAAEAVALRAGRLTEDNLHTVGVVALASGEVALATGYFTDGLRRSAHLYTSLDHVEGLALAAAYQQEDERALRLLAGATAVRADRLPRGEWWAGRLQAAAAAVHTRLPPAEAKAAVAAGARLTFEELAEYALTGRVPSRVAVDRPLNPREQQVARLIADGHRNRQIAARLSLSIRTVEAHTASIRRKLGLSSRAQIAHWVATYAAVPTDEE
jgi:DNA-binding CsgD family transcriptional regulator